MQQNKLEIFQRNIQNKKSEKVQGDVYISEQKKLKALVTDKVWKFFKEAGVIIAGGAITSVFTNKDVNDIDVYFKSEKHLFQTLAAIFGEDDYTPDHMFEILEEFNLIYNSKSQRTLMFMDAETDQHIQFMSFRYFNNAKEIFDSFDYTCCMGAYDCATERFILHEDFLKHNAQKYLKFHTGTAYPIMSLMRVDKYRDKGYDISKTELLRVIGTCMSLDIDSWKDAKEHIGGMYGYDLDDVFNESVEFSITEMVEQLSDIDERDIKIFQMENVDRDFWNVVKAALNIKAPTENEIVFDDNKYLYKCVTKEWTSPIASKKINYKEYLGKVLDSETGLYFHKHSTQPRWSSKYWVECELLEGDVCEMGFNEKVVKKGGKVKVLRCFEYDTNADITYTQEYCKKWRVCNKTPA